MSQRPATSSGDRRRGASGDEPGVLVPREVKDPADWLTEIQLPVVRDEARIATLAATG